MSPGEKFLGEKCDEFQKMDPPRPFEGLDFFGGKSKSKAPKAFKFGKKRVTIEVNNW